MKRLILFELILIFLATTFESDSPPGWFQQTLPVNKTLTDIFFLDSLTGWAVTTGAATSTDTGYVLKTSNGGVNWSIQVDSAFYYFGIQFLDINYGYAVGGTGRAKFLKTTNSGSTWNVSTPFGSNIYAILDLAFTTKDTGWVCSDDPFGGGIYKTTNGGANWQQQAGSSYRAKKLFMLNNDTGWAGSNDNKLYITTNSGTNWNLQFTFTQSLAQILFINKDTGFVTGGMIGSAVSKTVNGGFNWSPTSNSIGGRGLTFINSKYGWTCDLFSTVQKSTDRGETWFSLSVPNGDYNAIQFTDTLNGWSGGTKLIHTTDGGGPVGVQQISSEIPADYKLYQNYPNPFNPKTIIRYSLPRPSEGGGQKVKLVIFDITGKEITMLVNEEQTAGEYQADWDALGFASGIYFYSLIIDNKVIETKKMIFIK